MLIRCEITLCYFVISIPYHIDCAVSSLSPTLYAVSFLNTYQIISPEGRYVKSLLPITVALHVVDVLPSECSKKSNQEGVIHMRDYVIIGTTALRHRFEEKGLPLPKRLLGDKDLDILALRDTPIPYDDYDLINGENIIDKYSFEDEYATMDEIYTLKLSHIFWDSRKRNTWGKHIGDIVALQEMGCHVIDELYDVAKKEWIRRFGKPGGSLNKSKAEFFTGGVRRFVDHDPLHASVAFHERPLFYEFLKDGHDVLTDKDKFFALPYDKQIEAVQEEAMVLTLERDIIPMSYLSDKVHVEALYEKNLSKLVTQYTSGWFPEFIVRHWKECLALPEDKDFIQDFLDGVDNGTIQPGQYWDNRDTTWWGVPE